MIGDVHQFTGQWLFPLDPCKLSEICPHESMAKKQNQLFVIPIDILLLDVAPDFQVL